MTIQRSAGKIGSIGRSARVNRSGDGEPIGASIFLTADQLEQLGIESLDQEVLQYRVHNGELHLVGTTEVDSQHQPPVDQDDLGGEV